MSSANAASAEINATPCGPVWTRGRHIPQLDGVRGLAILIVTLYRFSKEFPTDSLLGKLLNFGLLLGDRGVDLFFVLSGFLITGILVDAKGHKYFFSHFLARRSLRIFPLYFVSLFLFVFVFNWLNPTRPMFAAAKEHQFFLWTYLTNVKMSLEGGWCFGSLDHFWSLAVEEHFYLFWPLVLFLCTQRTALIVACALAVVSCGSRIVFAAISDNGVAPDVLTIFRCDALLIGAALALQIRTPQGFQSLKKYTYAVFPVCLVMGLGCALLGKRLLTIGHTVWPLLWACVLVWLLLATQQHVLARLFSLAPLRKLGKYSYAMYVFQSPLIPITAGVLSAQQLSLLVGDAVTGHLLYIAAMFGLTYAAALLSWNVLEQHCLKLKDWFPSHTPHAREPRQTEPAPTRLSGQLASLSK